MEKVISGDYLLPIQKVQILDTLSSILGNTNVIVSDFSPNNNMIYPCGGLLAFHQPVQMLQRTPDSHLSVLTVFSLPKWGWKCSCVGGSKWDRAEYVQQAIVQGQWQTLNGQPGLWRSPGVSPAPVPCCRGWTDGGSYRFMPYVFWGPRLVVISESGVPRAETLKTVCVASSWSPCSANQV